MPDFDFDAFARNIRDWHATGDYPRRAAAELLISNGGYWLRRADFRSACTRTDRNGTYLMWRHAKDFAVNDEECEDAERAILKFAADLVLDPLGLYGLGDAYRLALTQAFVVALGVTTPGGAPSDA